MGRILAVFLALSLSITSFLPKQAHALVVGVAVGNPALVIAGGATAGFGIYLVIADGKSPRHPNAAGALGLAAIVVGIVLDQKNVDAGQSLAGWNIEKDLNQKIADGFYSEDEAREIITDYKAYQEKLPKDSATVIEFQNLAKKTPQQIVDQVTAIGLKSITAKYLIASGLGIQTE